MSADLESFFDDSPAEAGSVENTEAEVTTAEESATPAQETMGEQSSEGETEQVAEQASQSTEDTEDTRVVPLASLKAERGKRQDLERKVSELEQRFASLKAQEPEAKVPTREELESEYYSDPVGFVEKMKAEIRAEYQQAEKVREARKHASQEAELKAEFDDVEQMGEVFREAVKNDPGLRERALQSANPVRWAYDWAKDMSKASKYGSSFSEIEKNLRAEVTKEVEARLLKEGRLQQAAQLPQSQASAKAAGVTAPVTEQDVFKETFKDSPFQ